MKLIIAGTRTIDPYRAYFEFVKMRVNLNMGAITEFVTGGAEGPDQVPYLVQDIYGEITPLICEYPADWGQYGKAAGPLRNKDMAKYGDELCLIWDGKSRGSANMKEEMLKLGKKVHERILETRRDVERCMRGYCEKTVYL